MLEAGHLLQAGQSTCGEHVELSRAETNIENKRQNAENVGDLGDMALGSKGTSGLREPFIRAGAALPLEARSPP